MEFFDYISFYRELYPANMQCDYSIQVARGSTINLLVTDLNMEASSDCTFDYVAVSIALNHF